MTDETESLFARGRAMPRVRLGEETPPEESPCATCGTYYFHVHEAGCDREQCPACGGQLIAPG